MNNTATTYLKAASEVVPGDVVCESDGYSFNVLATEFHNKKYTFTLSPLMSGPATSSDPRKCTVKRYASIRVVGA